jgi:VanZ family protein
VRAFVPCRLGLASRPCLGGPDLRALVDPGTGLGTWDTVLRKGAHVTEYAILGVLLVRALGREAPAFLLGVGYAITDEIHQHFVSGRHASPIDVAIDSTGVLLGIVVSRAIRRSSAA